VRVLTIKSCTFFTQSLGNDDILSLFCDTVRTDIKVRSKMVVISLADSVVVGGTNAATAVVDAASIPAIGRASLPPSLPNPCDASLAPI
jgi:hypothetical protein